MALVLCLPISNSLYAAHQAAILEVRSSGKGMYLENLFVPLLSSLLAGHSTSTTTHHRLGSHWHLRSQNVA